jgi:outer membrane protein
MQAKQIAFGDKYQKIIEEFATKYSQEHNYDYILYHGKASQILYANKALEITNDFIKGINELKPSSTSDSSKK